MDLCYDSRSPIRLCSYILGYDPLVLELGYLGYGSSLDNTIDTEEEVMTEYGGSFITTYTGKKFHYLNPSEDEIDIIDIAHSLSLKCRFSGHVRVFYSVAEHSIRVAELLPNDLKLSGLLHDASEAYMPDVPRPIKEDFGLRAFEDTLMEVIQKKFGTVSSKRIHKADDVLIATEARDLLATIDGWAKLPKPLKAVVIPINSRIAEIAFLYRFEQYGGVRE